MTRKILLLLFALFLCAAPAQGTVTVETVRNDYSSAGSIGPYAYTFRVLASSDLEVIDVDASGTETILTENIHYTVTGVGATAGGTVTLVTAPAAGHTLTIRRAMPYLQTKLFTAQSLFSATAMNLVLDSLDMQIQQLAERADRAFTVPKSSTLTNLYLSPEANYLIGWDNAGIALKNYGQVTLTCPTLDQISNYDDIPDMVNDLGAATSHVFIPSASVVDTNTTVPDNICLEVLNGGRIRPDAGVTVTINNLRAGDYQIFDGAGKIILGPKVRIIQAVWFGFHETNTGAQNSAALLRMMNSAAGTVGGRVFVINPGTYDSDDNGWWSLAEAAVDTDGLNVLDSHIQGNVTIRATGAIINHIGTGHLMSLLGRASPGSGLEPPKWTIEGGSWNVTAASKSAFRFRDTNNLEFHPEHLQGYDGAGHAPHLLIFQDWYSWSENMNIGGSPELKMIGGGIQAEFQDSYNASVYESAAAPATHRTSFARTRMTNVFSGQAQTNILKIWGNTYGSRFWNFGGNNNTASALIKLESYPDPDVPGNTLVAGLGRTSIRDWEFEARGGRPVGAVIVDSEQYLRTVTPSIQYPTYHSLYWNPSGDDADVYPAMGSYQKSFVSLAAGASSIVLSKNIIRNNAKMLVIAKNETHTIFNAAIVVKKQGFAGLDFASIVATGSILDEDGSNNLQITNSLGTAENITVSIFEFGRDL
jgi:hypothetical protein